MVQREMKSEFDDKVMREFRGNVIIYWELKEGKNEWCEKVPKSNN